MKKWKQGITLIELIAVIIIISIIIGFGVASYNKMIYKIREREMMTQLMAIHGASQVYKAQNSQYYDSTLAGGVIGAAAINSALGTNVLENYPVQFSYVGVAGVYEARGRHNDPDNDFTVRMKMDQTAETSIVCCEAGTCDCNPCCEAGACPSLHACY